MASSQNLWALIMDAGTGFSAQVHELAPYFLHKVRADALVYLLHVFAYVENFACVGGIHVVVHFIQSVEFLTK